MSADIEELRATMLRTFVALSTSGDTGPGRMLSGEELAATQVGYREAKTAIIDLITGENESVRRHRVYGLLDDYCKSVVEAHRAGYAVAELRQRWLDALTGIGTKTSAEDATLRVRQLNVRCEAAALGAVVAWHRVKGIIAGTAEEE